MSVGAAALFVEGRAAEIFPPPSGPEERSTFFCAAAGAGSPPAPRAGNANGPATCERAHFFLVRVQSLSFIVLALGGPDGAW